MFSIRYIYIWLSLLFIVLSGTLSFGFAWSHFSIPTPFFNFTDSLFLFIILFAISYLKLHTRIVYRFTPIKHYYFLVILFGFELIKNIAFGEGSLPQIISGVKYFYIIMFLFPLVNFVKTEKEVFWFFDALIVLGIINGLVYYFQFITGTVLPASSGAYDHGVFRVNHPGFNLMAIALFVTFARFIVGRQTYSTLNYILIMFFLGVFIVSISRGLLLGLIAGLMAMTQVGVKGKTGSLIFYGLTIGFGVFVVGVFMLYQFNFNISSLTERFSEGVDSLDEDEEGAYDVRSEMMGVKMAYIFQNHPLFGVGYVFYQPTEDEKKWDYYNNPLAVVGDATYQNVVIVTGYIGLILWILILFKIFNTGRKLYHYFNDPKWKVLSLALVGLPIFMFLHSFASNYFNAKGLTFLVIISATTFWAYKHALELSNTKNEKIK